MFAISITPHFERELKRISKQNKKIDELYEESLEILESNPLNVSRLYKIKKLKDVMYGNGQWRIKIGEYRIRYDVIGSVAILYKIGDRKDVYK